MPPHRYSADDLPYKLLGIIALLLTLAILLAIIVTGSAFLLTRDTQAFSWGSASVAGLSAVLGFLLRAICKKS